MRNYIKGPLELDESVIIINLGETCTDKPRLVLRFVCLGEAILIS